MKRRSFLSGLAASAGVAIAPSPAVANVTKLAISNSHRVAGFHYGWAAVYAQMNDGICVADVAEKFRISMSDAQMLFDRMHARGVLHPPDLDGRSRATRPWQPWDKQKVIAERVAKEGNSNANQDNSSRAKQAFDALMAHVTADASFGWCQRASAPSQ